MQFERTKRFTQTSARSPFRIAIGTIVLPLALLGANRVCGQTKPNVQDTVSNLVKMHNAWGPGASSPNAALTIQEFSRAGRIMKFRLIAEGVAKDEIYTIVAWPVTQKQPIEVQRGVTLDASGLAICAGTSNTCRGDKPDDPIDLVFQPAPGEPLRLGLVSASGAIKVFAKTVPVPLRGEDRGCTVEGILLTPGSELVLIEGSGFPANSELTMDSNSEGEHHSQKSKADADGDMRLRCFPISRASPRGP